MNKRQFYMVDMGITRCCNMKCKFCTAVSTHEYNKKMTFEQFANVINKLNTLIHNKDIIFHRKFISYGNIGEPLLNPDFFVMNKYAKEHGWKTGMYTNGVLLTEEKIKKLYQSGGIDTINISITGTKIHIYKNFQGYGFSSKVQKQLLNTVLNNISKLIQIRNEQHKHTKIAVNYIVTKGTVLHLLTYIKHMAKLGVDEIRFTPIVDRPRRIKRIKINCRKLDKVLNIDEIGDISVCNNDFCKKVVVGNLFLDNWISNYNDVMCNMNNCNTQMLPEACQLCDRTNFASFMDYMSMNFHGYLKISNHRVLWQDSLRDYVNVLVDNVKWYFSERFKAI